MANYDIVIDGEPKEVTEIRHKILQTFKDLEFFEEGHKYYLHGVELPSVSSITHRFQEPFNEQETAERYASKNGMTAEYWLDKWHENSFRATTCGTRVHAYGESLGWQRNGHPELILDEIMPQYNKEKGWLVPIHPKEEAIVKFMNDLPKSYHLVLNEAKVFSGLNPNKDMNPTEQYCGTFDMLYYYDGDGDKSKSGLVIFDYKTNKDLYSSYARSQGKMMYPPFDELYTESLGNYTLQLSAYQIPLEDIGFKILGRKLIWLKEDGNYEMIKINDVTKELRNYLK